MEFTFGYWNILTLNRPGALASLLDVLNEYRIDITALQELNWVGQGAIKEGNHTIYYSCDDTSHVLGTGFAVAGLYRRFVVDFKPVSPRICCIRIKDKFSSYTMISCQAPTEASDEHEKNEFYQSLENTIKSSPVADIKIIGGDFDAEIGKDVIHTATIGMHSLHDINNDNGCRLIDFCASQSLFIGSTIFPHKRIHRGTWHSPDGLTIKQVDHLLFSAQCRYILNDVRVYRGPNFASDHYLSVATISPMLITLKKKRKIKKANTTPEFIDSSEKFKNNKKPEDLNLISIDDSSQNNRNVKNLNPPLVDDSSQNNKKVEDLNPSSTDDSSPINQKFEDLNDLSIDDYSQNNRNVENLNPSSVDDPSQNNKKVEDLNPSSTDDSSQINQKFEDLNVLSIDDFSQNNRNVENLNPSLVDVSSQINKNVEGLNPFKQN